MTKDLKQQQQQTLTLSLQNEETEVNSKPHMAQQLLFGKIVKSFFLFYFLSFFLFPCWQKKQQPYFILVQTWCQRPNGSCWIEPLFSCLLQDSGILDAEVLLWLLVRLQVFFFPLVASSSSFSLFCPICTAGLCEMKSAHAFAFATRYIVALSHVPNSVIKTPLFFGGFFSTTGALKVSFSLCAQLSVNVTSKAARFVKLLALWHSDANMLHLQKPAKALGCTDHKWLTCRAGSLPFLPFQILTCIEWGCCKIVLQQMSQNSQQSLVR